jgi:hypothetical protein
MNDQLSGQLTTAWQIPEYARDMLWLETDTAVVRAEGIHGLFTPSAPAEILTIRWGGEAGPALAQLRWQVDSLHWDGAVRIGGFVDAMHLTDLPKMPEPVVVLTVGGQPLKPGIMPFPDAAQRRLVPYPQPDFFEGIADEIEEGITTWATFEGSAPLTLAQDALVSKLRVFCFGHLAETAWQDYFALPIVLESMTLFAP